MRSAGDVCSLLESEQLVPELLFIAFLFASGSELIAPLLVSRWTLSPRVGLKDDADWSVCGVVATG
jgi:hypothetical protein